MSELYHGSLDLLEMGALYCSKVSLFLWRHVLWWVFGQMSGLGGRQSFLLTPLRSYNHMEKLVLSKLMPEQYYSRCEVWESACVTFKKSSHVPLKAVGISRCVCVCVCACVCVFVPAGQPCSLHYSLEWQTWQTRHIQLLSTLASSRPCHTFSLCSIEQRVCKLCILFI